MAGLLEALAVFAGGASLLLAAAGTVHAWRWARAGLDPPTPWRPFATVVVPCRGEHPGFEANVRATARQDYPEYEVLFVVDAADDPCAPALEALQAEEPRARLLLAEPAAVGTGWATGKIVAQLTGVHHADPRSEVFVFADADARPGPGWLAALVAPLAQEGVGGVTGYRWYTAEGPPTAWTALRDAWNAVGLDALTSGTLRFLWGGSMAVRRSDFERSRVRQAWRWTVSEDVGLTRAIRGLGLRIEFAAGALVASPEDWGPQEVRTWVIRQAALTRAALPGVFAFAAAVFPLSLALFAAGLALVLAWPSPLLGAAGVGMLAPVLSAVPRAAARQRLALRALPWLRSRPARERALQVALSLAVPLFMIWALARARRMGTISWRGQEYVLRREPSAPE